MDGIKNGIKLSMEQAVTARYAKAARRQEAALCCPVDYDPRYLKAIPQEVLDRDYGCGDPSALLREGETVLDLGSGGGKICFIAAQVVGRAGRVIGVDANDEMLALARRAAQEVARAIGFDNVRFVKARIQDLALDLDRLEERLREHPPASVSEWRDLHAELDRWRDESPLVSDTSVDVVVSNCVLNLVVPEDKPRLFREIHRVLKPGGRAVISDIVSDEDVPESLQKDAELWSGCLCGALREDRFLEAFEGAGLYGIRLLKRERSPWRTVEGIEFRSVTVEAFKGKEGPCIERNQAVIYKGPFREVSDDDGHIFRRGVPAAVCDKTFRILTREPYAEFFSPVPPRVEVPLDKAQPFACGGGTRVRSARDTKGESYSQTLEAAPCCGDGRDCR
jgi:SAM-dependent methyltransferase